MAATTITETNASHARKRLRPRESATNVSRKESFQETSNGYSDLATVRHSQVHDFKKELLHLYAPSAEVKIWGIAAKGLRQPSPPTLFPEYTKPGGVEYIYRELDFWTSGFFPGSLHLLLERRRKYGHVGSRDNAPRSIPHLLNLEHACTYWTENLHQNALLNSTHDLGFMIMPWAKVAYEQNHDLRALETIKTAAHTLYSRYSSKLGCIRSWDKCVTKKYNFQDLNTDFMVIIDNMMNLDLLFYAASKTGDAEMFSAAVQHARTTLRTHIRPDGSTTHLIVLDPDNGNIKHRLTNQGFSHTSCWARGQAWAIAGFAETYHWTLDEEFLRTSQHAADFFIARLDESGVVPWDFDARDIAGPDQPSDSSAAMIAAYGMLLIHKALITLGRPSRYLVEALRITQAVCFNHLNPPASLLERQTQVETVEHGHVQEAVEHIEMGLGDTIVNGATINNFEFAPRRWADHGLVYADYYFLLVGNKLLDMGIGAQILA
ncbi:unsaturated glucuronyl hydrolase [Paraphoma chrysanthemicola]|nr:unsaturated glucuronyl hydrolase [Paraphoma chrysanthemicola]